MQAQDVANQAFATLRFEAFESQMRLLKEYGYILDKDSTMLRKGLPQETLTSSTGGTAHSVSSRPFKRVRRQRCQRASNYSQHSVLSPLLQHVPASSRSKNMSLLSPIRFRSSQSTPANTNKSPIGDLNTGWASSPTPTMPLTDDQWVKGAYTC